ncbi:UNVERIFIED_CONTAM: hypothetical protein FKN15_053746 [Acipenser sinensis]
MQGLGKGVAAFIKGQHPHIYLVGCACHPIHIAAERTSREPSVSIEDHLITIFVYLEKSSKRKTTLREMKKMCDANVRMILKLCSTRWLSLGQCVNRHLEQWDLLTSFFVGEVNSSKPAKATKTASKPAPAKSTLQAEKSPKALSSSSTASRVKPAPTPTTSTAGTGVKWPSNRKQPRKKRSKCQEKKPSGTSLSKSEKVHTFLSDPVSDRNQALVKEEPCIQTLLSTLEKQLQQILLCFCKPEQVVAIMKNVGRGLKPTDHNKMENQLSDEELGVGHETKCFIESQTSLHLRQFYKDARQFFSSAADYMIRKCIFGDGVLVHAAVVDIHKSGPENI